MRDMSQIEQEYRDRGVVMLAVNVWEDEEAYRAFIESSRHELRWVRTDEASIEKFGLKGLPSQVIIGPEGRIRWTSSFRSLFDTSSAVRENLDRVLDSR